MINKKLIHFKTKSAFITAWNNREIPEHSIVFIKETLEIFTHNLFYYCPYSAEELGDMIGVVEYNDTHNAMTDAAMFSSTFFINHLLSQLEKAHTLIYWVWDSRGNHLTPRPRRPLILKRIKLMPKTRWDAMGETYVSDNSLDFIHTFYGEYYVSQSTVNKNEYPKFAATVTFDTGRNDITGVTELISES